MLTNSTGKYLCRVERINDQRQYMPFATVPCAWFLKMFTGAREKNKKQKKKQNSAESGVAPAPHSTPIPTKR